MKKAIGNETAEKAREGQGMGGEVGGYGKRGEREGMGAGTCGNGDYAGEGGMGQGMGNKIPVSLKDGTVDRDMLKDEIDYFISKLTEKHCGMVADANKNPADFYDIFGMAQEKTYDEIMESIQKKSDAGLLFIEIPGDGGHHRLKDILSDFIERLVETDESEAIFLKYARDQYLTDEQVSEVGGWERMYSATIG